MSSPRRMRIILSATTTSVVSIVTGILVNLATDQPSLAVVAGLVVVTAIGIALVVRESHGRSEDPAPSRTTLAAGSASVAVGGTNKATIHTSAPAESAPAVGPVDADVAAVGPGSVAIGQDNEGAITTGRAPHADAAEE